MYAHGGGCVEWRKRRRTEDADCKKRRKGAEKKAEEGRSRKGLAELKRADDGRGVDTSDRRCPTHAERGGGVVREG